jgi:hypothetical protein
VTPLRRIAGNAPLALPVLAVGIVASAALFAGNVHPVVGARVRGGPTEGARRLSYRLEVVERLGETERAVSGQAVDVAVALSDGQRLSRHGVTDDEGALALTFDASRTVTGPVRMDVAVAGVRGDVANGAFSLTPSEWSKTARRRGGWVESKETNGIVIRVAAERGVFAVPFRDRLWVDVRRDGNEAALAPGAAAWTAVTCECPLPDGKRGPLRFDRDADPHARMSKLILPMDHSETVSVTAKAVDGSTASRDFALAVVPGALNARGLQDRLIVESPIARDRAYVAVVSETERVAGGTVRLAPRSDGTASGVLDVELPKTVPLWAVVSSEPDLHSGAAVGWPVRFDPSEPATTFDAVDVLVLDNLGERVAREMARARRARLYAAAAAAVCMLLSAALVARRARASQRALESHLTDAGADLESTTRVAASAGATWTLVVAMLCLTLGALLVGLFGAFR